MMDMETYSSKLMRGSRVGIPLGEPFFYFASVVQLVEQLLAEGLSLSTGYSLKNI